MAGSKQQAGRQNSMVGISRWEIERVVVRR